MIATTCSSTIGAANSTGAGAGEAGSCLATGVLTGDFSLEEEEETAGLEVGVELEETERALKESARELELA